MKYVYPACFYKEENNCFSVIFPDMECATQGDSLLEAVNNAAEAGAGWIFGSLSNGEKLPAPSDIKDIVLEYENGFVSLVLIDLNNFQKVFEKKPVKKTLTIPSWLNVAAERKNINFSITLKEALLKKLS